MLQVEGKTEFRKKLSLYQMSAYIIYDHSWFGSNAVKWMQVWLSKNTINKQTAIVTKRCCHQPTDTLEVESSHAEQELLCAVITEMPLLTLSIHISSVRQTKDNCQERPKSTSCAVGADSILRISF